MFLYTGSKSNNAVAAAVCITLTSRLPDSASIFSDEAKAILLALIDIEYTIPLLFLIQNLSFNLLDT